MIYMRIIILITKTKYISQSKIEKWSTKLENRSLYFNDQLVISLLYSPKKEISLMLRLIN